MALEPRDVNERNQTFWQETEGHLVTVMTTNPFVSEEVLDELKRDSCGRDVRNQRTLEQILSDIEARIQRYQKEFSRRGGKAKKTDALSRLIEGFVEHNPRITCPQLMAGLAEWAPRPPIAEVDDETITLSNGKVVGLSGLKDRLSRTKKNRIRKTC